MALHPVQDDDLPLRRPGWGPDRDLQRIAIGRRECPRLRQSRLSHTGPPGLDGHRLEPGRVHLDAQPRALRGFAQPP